jgi:hypothetical protein
MKSPEKSNMSVTLTDILGKTLSVSNFLEKEGIRQESIGTESLTTGIYFINIFYNSEYYKTFKILIVR